MELPILQEPKLMPDLSEMVSVNIIFRKDKPIIYSLNFE